MQSPFIRRIAIRNFKSIEACRVDLRKLMFLIGPNGTGKSNFLDAFRFVAESLRSSLDHALRDRGTIQEVRRRSGGHPNHFALRFDFELENGSTGHYSFRIGAKSGGGFDVQEEECRIWQVQTPLGPEVYYSVRAGEVRATFQPAPVYLPDRLYLVAASGVPEFRPVYEALSRMEIYNLDPRQIGAVQKPDPGELLRRDGSNAASVLRNLPEHVRARVNSYLSRIVDGLVGAEHKTLGSMETLEFRQVVGGQRHPWRFLASSMSDGTLRAFGILVAVLQATALNGGAPLLIGLEEPESGLHPGATALLQAALREGAQHCQILVTSHSPDLLDSLEIDTASLLAVVSSEGSTQIGPIDPAARALLHDRLFTAGELLRQNQIAVDEAAVSMSGAEHQRDMFDCGNATS